ncbi:MAG: secondary thiamine-phosphate synthase enzyme YjbQ [Candidatus Omnitrophota bacterium]|nr:secondary thiamine-phosphate synthase enzyme YjbQ [Candidatus Omnitrophota bacterium]
MEKLNIKTDNRIELIDITDKIEAIINKSKVKEGICIVFVPHTTAGITINENADPSVRKDILKELNKIIPFEDNYSHSEGNAAAHIKASLLGASINLIIEGGALKLGTWQGIYFCEFDGPRQREAWVKIMEA